MLTRLGAPFRLLSIARTLARHDALAPLEELGIAPLPVTLARMLSRRRAEGRPGQKLARALTELGPAFIKLGQFLSTRSDLLGEQVAADLSDLQDRLKPFPAPRPRRSSPRSWARRWRRSSGTSTRRRSRPPPSPRCTWR